MSSAAKRVRISDERNNVEKKPSKMSKGKKNPVVIAPYQGGLCRLKTASYGDKMILFCCRNDEEVHFLRVFFPEFGLWLKYDIRNEMPVAQSDWESDLIIHQDRMIIIEGSNFISSLDLTTLEWSRSKSTGNIPRIEAFFVHHDKLWIYGGSGLICGDLSLEQMRVQTVQQYGDIPSRRKEPTLTNMGDGRVVLFGGSDVYPPFAMYNDIYILNMSTLSWTRLNIYQESTPLPRDQHTAVKIDERRIAFIGGRHESVEGYQRLNDIWILDTEIWQWNQIDHPPYFRSALVCAALLQGNVYIFDGERVVVIKFEKNPDPLRVKALRALAKSEMPLSEMVYSPSPSVRIPITDLSIKGLTALKIWESKVGKRINKNIIDISSVTSLNNLKIDMV